MFWREHGRYVLSIIFALIMVVLVLVLLFRPGPASDSNQASPETSLTSYIDQPGSAMEVMVKGPIVARSQQQTFSITVSRISVNFNLSGEYGAKSIGSSSYPNSQNAYREFIKALSFMGFNKGVNDPALADDEGYCPTGNRYIFMIKNNGHNVSRYWLGSCTAGSFRGQSAPIINLFIRQVPDFGSGPSAYINFGY